MGRQKNERLKLVQKNRELPGWKKALRFLLRVTVIVLLLALLRHGETYFRINYIEVRGAEEITAADIIAAGEIKKGMSIILLQEEKITAAIQGAYPKLSSVEISRTLPDRITITVDERRPAAYIMTADGFWLADSNTVPYANMVEPTEDFPVISGIEGRMVVPGYPLDCKVRTEALRNFFAAWRGEDRLEIERIDLSDSYNLIVYTADELEIWFGNGKDLEKKLELVELSMPYIAIETEMRLDVRSGKRLIVSSAALADNKGVEP